MLLKRILPPIEVPLSTINHTQGNRPQMSHISPQNGHGGHSHERTAHLPPPPFATDDSGRYKNNKPYSYHQPHLERQIHKPTRNSPLSNGAHDTQYPPGFLPPAPHGRPHKNGKNDQISGKITGDRKWVTENTSKDIFVDRPSSFLPYYRNATPQHNDGTKVRSKEHPKQQEKESKIHSVETNNRPHQITLENKQSSSKHHDNTKLEYPILIGPVPEDLIQMVQRNNTEAMKCYLER